MNCLRNLIYKLTITRNLKINLGDSKYKETISRNKIQKNYEINQSTKKQEKRIKITP